jgi:hypothetical protein
VSYPAFLAHPDNNVVSATVSESSQSSTYPAVNVRSLPISQPWRTTGITSEYVEFDLGSAHSITLIALINHNLTSGATITVKAGASANPSTFTQVMTWRKYDAFVVIAAQSYRYWRITFADTGNTNSYLSVGYIMLGAYTQMNAGFAYAFPFADVQANLSLPTEFNVPHNVALAYQVQFSLTFSNLTDTNMNVIRALFLEVFKNVYPFFWIPDSAVNDAYLMRFGNDFTRTMDFYRSATVSLIEDSRGAVTAS